MNTLTYKQVNESINPSIRKNQHRGSRHQQKHRIQRACDMLRNCCSSTSSETVIGSNLKKKWIPMFPQKKKKLYTKVTTAGFFRSSITVRSFYCYGYGYGQCLWLLHSSSSSSSLSVLSSPRKNVFSVQRQVEEHRFFFKETEETNETETRGR